MSVIETTYFDKETIKKEICNLIDNNGVSYYEVSRIAEPMSVLILKVELDLIYNEDGKIKYFKEIKLDDEIYV